MVPGERALELLAWEAQAAQEYVMVAAAVMRPTTEPLAAMVL